MSVSEIQLYNILKSKIGDEQAQSLVEFVDYRVHEEMESKQSIFATKEDLTKAVSDLRADLLRTIYLVGIVQLVGIIGSVIAIVKYMR